MTAVGRYVKMTASAGDGDALATAMLRVAEQLRGVGGCEQYVINRSPTNPDEIWVTERWLSQEALDASLEQLQTDAGKAQLAEVTALLAGPPERIELEPIGGVGHVVGGTGATIVNLDDVEDMAPKFGFGELGEARFATSRLGSVATGVAHQRLRPHARQGFGHRHEHAEEVYVVLAGSGRIRVDEEIHEIRALDAIRVAPESMRAFEAGPDGLEVLALGPRHPGDGEVQPSFWPAET